MAKTTELPKKRITKKPVVEKSNGEWPTELGTKISPDHIEDITHTEIPNSNGLKVVPEIFTPEQRVWVKDHSLDLLTAEQKAKNEVSKFDVARAWIATKKEEYLKLSVADIEDKAGLTVVTKAWQEIRNKRLLVEKKHKELKGDYLVITRAIDGEKNELVDLLREIEDPLKLEIDRIEEAKEYVRQEAERKAQEKLQSRVVELLESGMKFNGSYYAIGESITLDVLTIRTLDDSKYGELLQKVKAEQQKIVDAENERLRLEQEEKDRIQKQKAEQEAERIKLEKERADLDKEKKEMREQRTKGRADALTSLGMLYDYSSCVFKFVGDGKTLTVPVGTVEALDNEKWAPEYEDIFNKIEVIKKALKVAADLQDERDKKDRELKTRTASRCLELKNLFGMIPIADGLTRESSQGTMFIFFDDIILIENKDWPATIEKLQDEFNEILQAEAAELEREELLKEAEKEAAMSDLEKVRKFLKGFETWQAKPQPTIVSSQVLELVAEFDNTVTSAYKNLIAAIELIEAS